MTVTQKIVLSCCILSSTSFGSDCFKTSFRFRSVRKQQPRRSLTICQLIAYIIFFICVFYNKIHSLFINRVVFLQVVHAYDIGRQRKIYRIKCIALHKAYAASATFINRRWIVDTIHCMSRFVSEWLKRLYDQLFVDYSNARYKL